MHDYVPISELKGLTFTDVRKEDSRDGNDAVVFTSKCGRKFVLTHSQNCCENVYIESIVGDLSDLENTELLQAEERTNEDPEQNRDGFDESQMWTFYSFATIKGYVDIRFHGSSNGYYGVGVSLYEIDPKG